MLAVMGAFVITVLVIVSMIVVRIYAPHPRDREELRRVTLRLRNAVTDWDASRDRR
ncbi:hypothetical protein [Nocardia sp. NPDC046763]|uniref:hypothetical protein n=1 Tax=Nocardia sp. NPDC046763 TaxID=3155256 RepID=UPI0033CEE767